MSQAGDRRQKAVGDSVRHDASLGVKSSLIPSGGLYCTVTDPSLIGP